MANFNVTVLDQKVRIDVGESTAAANAAAAQSAASAASSATSASASAVSAGVAEALAGPAYASTAAGLAATSNGDFFAVNNAGRVTIYLNSAGSAVAQRDLFTLDYNLGTLQSGSTDAIDIKRTASAGAADGTSQFYSFVNRVYAQGSTNYEFVRAQYCGARADTTGGTIAQLDGIHAFCWLGGAGNVTNAVGIAAHIRADGPGDVTNDAIWFRCIDADFVGGSTINTAKGLSIGQIGGDGANVTNAYGVDIEDTDAVSVTIGLRGSISAGPNKYNIFCGGTAQSCHLGNFGIGFTGQPLWALTVREDSTTIVADFGNTNASSPFGIRIQYTAAAPDGTDNDFITCQDTASTKFQVKSNGTVWVRGSQVVTGRRPGWAAATGTATRTSFATGTVTTAQLAERVKALIDDLIAHGLIGA